MKDNAIDRIFRDKLAALEREPSEAAWNKLDSGLKGRKKAIWVMLKAAAIALVCIAAAYLVYDTTEQKGSNPPVAGKQAPHTTAEEPDRSLPEKMNPPQTARANPPEEKRREIAVSENNNPGKKEGKEPKEPKEKMVATADGKKGKPGKQANKPEREKVVQLASQTPSGATPEPENQAAEPNPEDEPEQKLAITIIYKSGSKSQPTLAVKKREAETSTLEKIVDKAKEIKGGELSLAGFREAKDDLFALNFRSDEE